MGDEVLDRERLTRTETQLIAIGLNVTEVKQLLGDLARRLEGGYTPRPEMDQRFAHMEKRITQLEGRGNTIPPWVTVVGSFLIGVVSLLGGSLIGVILNR